MLIIFFTLCSTIRARKSKGRSTFACFVNMMKAFGRVDYDCLLAKLLTHGINGNFYRTLKNLYNCPKSCVMVNDNMTKWFDVESGVKQGDVISPTPFSLCINDLVTEINNLNIVIPVGSETKVSYYTPTTSQFYQKLKLFTNYFKHYL